jgi:c-di-GMP-binding flagellar brake protein YcgR
MRYGLPTKTEIHCPSLSAGQNALDLSGIALDISIGGISVDLEKQSGAGSTPELKGRLVEIKLDLLNNVAVLNLSGKVVWQRCQSTPEGASDLIGIRFDTLNSMDRQMLMEYCSGSVGEQNLLWSLWDTMVKDE